MLRHDIDKRGYPGSFLLKRLRLLAQSRRLAAGQRHEAGRACMTVAGIYQHPEHIGMKILNPCHRAATLQYAQIYILQDILGIPTLATR